MALQHPTSSTPRGALPWRQALLAFSLAAGLVACGGEAQQPESTAATQGAAVLPPSGEVQTGPEQASSSAPAQAVGPSPTELAADAAALQVLPAYHLAPVLPGAPSDVDRDGSSASALQAPRRVGLPTSVLGTSTRALGLHQLVDGQADKRALGSPAGAADERSTAAATPAATAPKVAVTYTPAQIRAAYGLPPVPSNLNGITSLQAAQLGAGQTIYVVDAFHSPFAFSELLAFSNLFGLPPCTSKTLAANAALPLPAPSSTACEFYQVFSGTAGAPTSTAPRYDAQWAIEIAMDIQWAHAIAPLARIVLIEASSASMGAISSAIQLANRMGPGVVSMSFAAPEGSYVAGNDSLFQARGMSYFAATGDDGTAVNWPAVSPYVVAVGGTSLNFSGTGTRSEAAWSLAGGGVSAFVATPTYQKPSLLRPTALARRSVADVAMNADPSTGQFVAVIPNPLTCSFCQVSWITSGGTSLSTPQWAGLAAVANARRAQTGKAALGAPHALLYQPLSSGAAAYSAAYLDVAQGANGSCATCTAKAGYDGPTGLGTPNGLNLINLLAESVATPAAPTVVGATLNGKYGEPVSFTPSVSSVNAYSLSLSGAPAGMALAGSVVSWPNPTKAGTFSVKVVAKDLKTGLTGQGTYTVVVAPPPPPFVSAGSLTAVVGKPLTFAVAAGGRYASTLSLVSPPSGMSLSANGRNVANVNWPKPVAGVYRVVVKAVDQQTGLSAQGVTTLAVNVAAAPQVSAGHVAGRPGQAFSVPVTVVSATAYTLSLVGAPAGMAINASGLVSWAKPVAGDYAVTVQAKDSKTGVVGSAVLNVSIGSTTGPSIMASLMSGVAGKPFSGSISITDGSANLVGVGFGGPNGMKFNTQGGLGTTLMSWAAPVAGSYTVQVSATNSAGKSATALLPLVITAK